MKKISFDSKWMVLLILACVPVSQLAIDMYLPSLPAMTEALHATSSSMQLTLTTYLFAIAISQLVYGPLSDRFGRRRVFLCGFLIFLIGSFFCALSHDATTLLIARFFQGLGGGCGFVISNAMMADLFTGKKLVRMITYGSLTWSLTPIIAPMIGGFVQQFLGWRENFLIIFIYSVLLWLAVFIFMPETLHNENRYPLHPVELYHSYLTILKNKKFIGFIICVAFSYGAVIAFNVTGPFILQEALKVNAAEYGVYVLFVGVAYSLGVYLNSQLLKLWPMMKLLRWGMIWTVLSGVILVLFSWLNWFDVTSVIAGTIVLQLAQGLVFANCLSGSLAIFNKQNGTISALFGCFVLLGCTSISAVISELHIVNQIHLGLVYIILGLLGIVGYVLVLKTK